MTKIYRKNKDLENWEEWKVFYHPNKEYIKNLFKTLDKNTSFVKKYGSSDNETKKYIFVFERQVSNWIKTSYDFYILKDWNKIYENDNKWNFSNSLKFFFRKVKTLPEFKNRIDQKIELNWIKSTIIKWFEENFDLLIGEQNDIDIYTSKTVITKEELHSYLNKELDWIKDLVEKSKNIWNISMEEIEKLPKKEQIEMKKLKKLSQLVEIKDKMLFYYKNKETLTELPSDLYELAVKDRWRMSKLEKVLVNNARELVINIYTNNINFENEWIKEVEKRTFWRIDDRYDKIYVTEEDAVIAWVPLNKNLYKLIELELKGRASGRVLIELDKLKKLLNWKEVDIITHIYASMLESVYFFRPELQEESISFDTFIVSTIKKSIQDLKNYTIKVDQNWGRKERQKDDLIKDKLKRYKYELEIENKEYSIENIWEKANFHNENTTTFKISKKDIEKFKDSLTTHYVSFDAELNWDEWNMKNEFLQEQLWSDSGSESDFNPQFVVNEKMKAEGSKKAFNQIAKTIEEQIIWDIWIENFANLAIWTAATNVKNALKFELNTFNRIYSKYGKEPISKKELDIKTDELTKKIYANQDLFRMLISENL